MEKINKMASHKEYLDFITDQLSNSGGVTYRAMMGEYIIYYRGKIVGGIYDDRFLIKPTEAAKKMIPDATYEIPYEGGKEMILVDNVDDREFLSDLIIAVASDLPEPVKRSSNYKN